MMFRWWWGFVLVVQYGKCWENRTNHSRHLEVANNNNLGCGSSPTPCLKCGPKGCIKCPNLIVYPSRICVNTCPQGHTPNWSTRVDYMGLVCTHNGNFMGLSSNTLSVLSGILIGAVACLTLLTSGFLYIKYVKRKIPAGNSSSETSSELEDSSRDFLKQLETLRPYAQNYLDMLNDTRRQLRELHQLGDNSAISAYKPVVRDLAKILLLLNRPVEKVALSVPEDWEHLFNWAQKTLRRYKRMSQDSQPQVAQLVNFLQGSVPADQLYHSGQPHTMMSTFKPDQVLFGSSVSLQDLAVSAFNANYDLSQNKYDSGPLNPQWKFEYSLVGGGKNLSSEFDPKLWRNSKEYLNSSLFLDDDFGQLGFRPQDEITTEL